MALTEIKKELAGVEDLLIGTGTVNQTRGGETVPITKITLSAFVDLYSDLINVDTSKYTTAIVNASGSRWIYNNGKWMPSNGVANVKDFGAIEDQNIDSAITEAFTTINNIVIDSQYKFTGVELESSQNIYGLGRGVTVLTYTPDTGTAIKYKDSTTSRAGIHDMSIIKEDNGSGRGSTVGFDNTLSSFNSTTNCVFTFFNIGVMDNDGVGSFSARNYMELVEANDCNTGLFSEGGNTNSYQTCRFWGNEVVGIRLITTEGLNFYGCNVESNPISLQATNSKASFFGGYLESGTGNKNFDIDNDSRIDFYNPQINGDRGYFNIDPNNHKSHLDIPDTAASFGKYTPFSAADRQYIKNPDFSRVLNNTLNSWFEAGGINVLPQSTGQESGNRYVQLTATTVTSRYQTSFKPEKDVKEMTLMCRYWQRSGTCRIEVTQGATILAQFNGEGTVDTGWNTAIIRVPALNSFDGLGTDVVVSIYPDTSAGTGRCDIDQVWMVKGQFGSSPRGYEQKVEVLQIPQILVQRTAQSSNVNDTFTPTDVPDSAVGMRLRIKIQSTLASTVNCTYTIFGTNATIAPFRDGLDVSTEFTINATSGVIGQLLITSGGNAATYTVEVVEWILD